MRRQRQETWSLFLPCLGHRPAVSQAAAQVSATALRQNRVQLRERLDLGQRYDEVAPSIADEVFHEPLLMTLARPTEDALEQVVRAEGDELLLLLAPAAAEDLLHGGRKVVVGDRAGHAAQLVEGCDVAGVKRLPGLARISHDEEALGVAEAEAEEV